MKYSLESFHSLATDKGIRLSFQTEHAAFIMDYDPEKLQEIVSNLISNALKFTEPGGTIRLSVAAIDKNKLRISVIDTGQGISSRDLPHIFDRHFTTTSTTHEGAGIGLTLTKKLVLLLGGDISVESELGKGSTFIVDLPVKREALLERPTPLIPHEDKRLIQHSPTLEKPPVPTDTPIVQIIEDNADVVRYLRSILQDIYQLQVAENGAKGIDIALDTIPDLIISDVMMPKADGYEVCRTLKQDKRSSHIPIILLTAKADQDSRIEGLERGADAYLIKPFDPQELLVRIRKLIESRKRFQMRYQNADLPPTEEEDLLVEDAFIKQVRGILQTHIDDPQFGISDLYTELGIARAPFYRKFSALTGQPIGQYFKKMKLEKAKKLIENTNLNISEVAYESGFREPAYFSRVFKEHFGVRPSDLRQNA